MRRSQALELGSPGRVGSQEGIRSSVFGARISLPVGGGMTGPITRPSLNPHASHRLVRGRALFSCPLALGSAVQLVLANVPDA